MSPRKKSASRPRPRETLLSLAAVCAGLILATWGISVADRSLLGDVVIPPASDTCAAWIEFYGLQPKQVPLSSSWQFDPNSWTAIHWSAACGAVSRTVNGKPLAGFSTDNVTFQGIQPSGQEMGASKTSFKRYDSRWPLPPNLTVRLQSSAGLDLSFTSNQVACKVYSGPVGGVLVPLPISSVAVIPSEFRSPNAWRIKLVDCPQLEYAAMYSNLIRLFDLTQPLPQTVSALTFVGSISVTLSGNPDLATNEQEYVFQSPADLQDGVTVAFSGGTDNVIAGTRDQSFNLEFGIGQAAVGPSGPCAALVTDVPTSALVNKPIGSLTQEESRLETGKRKRIDFQNCSEYQVLVNEEPAMLGTSVAQLTSMTQGGIRISAAGPYLSIEPNALAAEGTTVRVRSTQPDGTVEQVFTVGSPDPVPYDPPVDFGSSSSGNCPCAQTAQRGLFAQILDFFSIQEPVASVDCPCADDPPSVPVCGDEIIEGDEMCDGGNVGAFGCSYFGPQYDAGFPSCDSGCMLTMGSCVNSHAAAGCNNDGIRQDGEQCDGTDFGGNDCGYFGPGYTGTLSCNDLCQIEIGSCNPSCSNNNVKEPGEECDGTDLGGLNCAYFSPLYDIGTPFCNNCVLEAGTCAQSGPVGCNLNGIKEIANDEVCDGADFGGIGCSYFGSQFNQGEPSCDASCQIQIGTCSETAPPACANLGEECDGWGAGILPSCCAGSLTCGFNGEIYICQSPASSSSSSSTSAGTYQLSLLHTPDKAQPLPGEVVVYTIRVSNTGFWPALSFFEGPTLTDVLPPGVTFLSAMPPPAAINGQTITWNLSPVWPLVDQTVVVSATVDQGASATIPLTATASIPGASPAGASVTVPLVAACGNGTTEAFAFDCLQNADCVVPGAPGGVCTANKCVEQCDDGNKIDGDGCSAACRQEVASSAPASSSPSSASLSVPGTSSAASSAPACVPAGMYCSAAAECCGTGATCAYDPGLGDTACGVCGDGAITGGEQCDGANFGSATCATSGYDNGVLTCAPGCIVSVSTCSKLPVIVRSHTALPMAPKPGQVVVYTLVVENTSVFAATNVSVLDDLPSALQNLVSAGGAGQFVNGDFVVTLPVLGPGAAAAFTLTGTVPANANAGDSFAATATVNGGSSTTVSPVAVEPGKGCVLVQVTGVAAWDGDSSITSLPGFSVQLGSDPANAMQTDVNGRAVFADVTPGVVNVTHRLPLPSRWRRPAGAADTKPVLVAELAAGSVGNAGCAVVNFTDEEFQSPVRPTKTASVAKLQPDDPMDYTITLTNDDANRAVTVNLQDTLPSQVSYQSLRQGGTDVEAVQSGNSITWSASVPAGQSVSFTMGVRAKDAAALGYALSNAVNTVNVIGGPSDSVTVPVDAVPPASSSAPAVSSSPPSPGSSSVSAAALSSVPVTAGSSSAATSNGSSSSATVVAASSSFSSHTSGAASSSAPASSVSSVPVTVGSSSSSSYTSFAVSSSPITVSSSSAMTSLATSNGSSSSVGGVTVSSSSSSHTSSSVLSVPVTAGSSSAATSNRSSSSATVVAASSSFSSHTSGAASSSAPASSVSSSRSSSVASIAASSVASAASSSSTLVVMVTSSSSASLSSSGIGSSASAASSSQPGTGTNKKYTCQTCTQIASGDCASQSNGQCRKNALQTPENPWLCVPDEAVCAGSSSSIVSSAGSVPSSGASSAAPGPVCWCSCTYVQCENCSDELTELCGLACEADNLYACVQSSSSVPASSSPSASSIASVASSSSSDSSYSSLHAAAYSLPSSSAWSSSEESSSLTSSHSSSESSSFSSSSWSSWVSSSAHSSSVSSPRSSSSQWSSSAAARANLWCDRGLNRNTTATYLPDYDPSNPAHDLAKGGMVFFRVPREETNPASIGFFFKRGSGNDPAFEDASTPSVRDLQNANARDALHACLLAKDMSLCLQGTAGSRKCVIMSIDACVASNFSVFGLDDRAACCAAADVACGSPVNDAPAQH